MSFDDIVQDMKDKGLISFHKVLPLVNYYAFLFGHLFDRPAAKTCFLLPKYDARTSSKN